MDRFDLEENRMNTHSDVSNPNRPPQTREELLQSLVDAERQIAHLRTLQEISCKLNSELSLEDVLTSILDEAIRAIRAERGCLFLMNEAAGVLEVHLCRRLRSSDLDSESFRPSRTVIERAWRDGNPVITANALKDPTLSKADSVIKHTLRSILCVPLHRHGQRIGVLYLDNRLKANQFQEDDLALVVAIADQAAVALHNAQLYQAAQQELAERKRAEKQLRLLSSAVEQSSEGIAVADLDGNLLFVNDAFAAMHGYCPGELVGKHLSVFHTPEQMASVEAANYELQEMGEFSGEIWHARRDGTLFPTLMHNSLLRDEMGNPIGMIGTMRDITKQVQAEESIRRRNLELELLNQTSKAFSSTLDLDQVLANVLEGVRYLLGVTASSIWLVDPETGELACRQATGPNHEIVRGWRLAAGQGVARRVARSGESLIVPDVHADGRHYKDLDHKTGLEIRSILSVPLRAKGDVKGVIQVVDTEPDRFGPADQRLVEALASSAAIAIENARLYARNRQMAIEQERHRLARDLHDTVTQYLYSAGLAAQTSLRLLDQTDVDSQLRSSIEYIRTVTQTAMAQMQEELYDLHPTTLADNELVGALARHCEMLQEQYPLAIKFTASREPSLSASQREDLYSIAREALWNVVKHAHAARVVILLTGEDDCVELSIVDDGAGFDPSIASTKQTMGLRSIQERTRQMAGTFEMESRPEHGTRITVRIPIRSPEDTKAPSS
jgi:PAS domain S-box-containing protein